MRPIFPYSVALGIFLMGSLYQGAFSATHSRALVWGMEKGNLVPNWSFENTLQFWSYTSPNGFSVNAHHKATTVSEGGSFVGRVSGNAPANGTHLRLTSSQFPLEPGVSYTLSFYYTAASLTGQTWPEVQFFRDRVTSLPAQTGSAYPAASGFTLYVLNFTAPENASYARLVLAASTTQNHGGTFQFDNVVLEEGWYAASDVQAIRARTNLSVSFGDQLGRVHQTYTRIGAGKYQAVGSGFEDFARPESTFLPVSINTSSPAYRTDLLTLARNHYNGTSGVPNSETWAFSEVQYANEPGARVLASGSSGTNFRLGSTHVLKSGFFFSSALLPQGFPANIEAPATDNSQREYRVDWSRDADSNFTLSWTNRQGQLVQTASNITKGGTSAANWSYAFKQFDYYPNGRLKRVRTPLDIAASNTKFSEVTQYNTLGQVVSNYTKNSGLTRYWYNRSGSLRFSQDSGQKLNSEFTYREYDSQNRLVSQGVQVLAAMTQAIADQDRYEVGKQERIGYVYDDYDLIASRIGGGYTLDQIIPHHYYIDKSLGYGRLVCQYNRNSEGRNPSFTDLDNLVADFFGYATDGNLRVILKAVHPVRDPAKKFQDAYFVYDELNRIVESYNYLDASSGTFETRHRYSYDMQGRVQKVVGLNDKPLAEFSWYDWGPLKQVILGGNGTGAQGTRVEYFYHIQGWLREIKCTNLSTGKLTYQELLGYDGKAHSASQVPGVTKPRYGGQISQMLYSLGRDVASQQPVRLVNYNYDDLGRMIAADYRKNNGSDPYNTDESINFGAPLTWNTSSNENDSYFAYDLNGRITGQRSGNVSATDSARYGYYDGTYKLDSVGGRINNVVNRDMKPRGTFVYDGRGRLTWDNSKQLEIIYGWDNLPVEFISYANGAPEFQYDYYDASGNRVSKYIDGATYSSVHYLSLGPGNSKEWWESYSGSGVIISTSSVVNLFGNTYVGRIRQDGGYEFVLKNHQGSSVKVVTDIGSSGNHTYDYLAYGDLRNLKENGSSLTQKFTGKEYERISRLYSFGARSMDSELGIFLIPDPEDQFINPYTYGPNSPTNGTDPDGRFWEWNENGISINHRALAYGALTGDWAGSKAWNGGEAQAGGAGYDYGDYEMYEAIFMNVTGKHLGVAGGYFSGSGTVGSAAQSAFVSSYGCLRFGCVDGAVINFGIGKLHIGPENDWDWNNPFQKRDRAYQYQENVGDFLGWVGATYDVYRVGSYLNQSVQNQLLYDRFGSNEEIFGNGNVPKSVETAEGINSSEGPLWRKDGELPSNRADGGGRWKNLNKCNKYLCESNPKVPRNKSINALADNAVETGRTIQPNQVRTGDVMLLKNPTGGSGHGMLIGRGGSFLHATTALGGAVETTGWARFIYMRHHSDKVRYYVRY